MPKVWNIADPNCPNDAIYCGRGSPHGNPFHIGRDGDRDTVCNRFECETLPTLNVARLRGCDLKCYCKPRRCHCDSIIKKANIMKATILDTETTGLINNRAIALEKQPEVIEFYSNVVDLGTGKIGRKFETLVKPATYPMTDKTIQETKTKLTNAMLANAPPFKLVAKAVRKIIEEAEVVIAHNAAFDREMLDIEFERMGEKLKWPMVICTIEQTVHIKGYRLSLTNLHIELFKEAFKEAHRARTDVAALTRCCIELYKRKLL